jgi:hypothetical protein
MGMAREKRPTSPRDPDDWRNGSLPGSPKVAKYAYCVSGPETFSTIAKSHQSHVAQDGSGARFPPDLMWRDITQLNYGTDDPREINWYLRKFNGASKIDVNGNYVLDKSDSSPFLYVPLVKIVASSNVSLSRGTQANLHTPPRTSELTEAALRRYDDIDVEHRGFLKKNALIRCVADKSFSGVDGAMVATLYKCFSDMEDFSNDEFGPETKGITRADLVAFDRIRATNPSQAIAATIENLYRYFKTKIQVVGSDLYATPNVDPLMVCQGVVGDCWFLSALVALKDRADDIVKSSIRQSYSGDADYVVEFRGKQGTTYPVVGPTDAQIGILATTYGNGLWLTVLEVAHGMLEKASDPIDGADTGGLTGTGISLLTGHDTDVDYTMVTKDATTRDKLTKAVNENRAVTACIRTAFTFWQKEEALRDGWPMAHVYTVLSYDPGTNIVRVRNPWGHEANGTERLSGQTVTFEVFTQTWTAVAYEEVPGQFMPSLDVPPPPDPPPMQDFPTDPSPSTDIG